MAHRHTDKKKKHREICIETSQCLISIIEMFFSNLPMFFRTLQKDKRTKRTDVTIAHSSWYRNHEISY